VFIRHGIFVLVHESFGFVLNVMCIVDNSEGVVRESGFLKVVLIRGRSKGLVEFVAESLIGS
jgi:hypothetical protein